MTIPNGIRNSVLARIWASVLIGLIVCLAPTAFGQTTAFTYQGTMMNGGAPANGSFAMEFRLFDASVGGTQIGSTVSNGAVVITNGVYAVAVDFGAAAFSGPDRFLQVTVDGNVLSPRTQLLSAPYAIRAKTVTGPVTATNPTAALIVSNDQPGITDPSLVAPGPAALSASATSGVDANVGVFASSNGAGGIGVLAVTNGSGESPNKTYGLVGVSTTQTGRGAGISALSMSPDSNAIEADAENGGLIFKGVSNDPSSANPKFAVTSIGQVQANGGVFAKGFHLNSGLFDVLEDGSLGATSINAATIASTGNVTVGGTLNATNVQIGSGSLSVGNITATGDMNVGGILGGPNGNIQLGPNSLFTNGSVNSFNSTVGGQLTVSGPISVGQGATITGVVNTGPLNTPGMHASGNVQIDGILTVFGAKNNVIKLKNGDSAFLYANESPEYWFEDFGTVKLLNGRAIVEIDPVFAEATNTNVPYKIFLTANGNTHGLYVIRKSPTSFEVRENRYGRSNVTFDYRIVAKRRGYEAERFGLTATHTRSVSK